MTRDLFFLEPEIDLKTYNPSGAVLILLADLSGRRSSNRRVKFGWSLEKG